jgi:hypothetical protein
MGPLPIKVVTTLSHSAATRWHELAPSHQVSGLEGIYRDLANTRSADWGSNIVAPATRIVGGGPNTCQDAKLDQGVPSKVNCAARLAASDSQAVLAARGLDSRTPAAQQHHPNRLSNATR